RRVDTGPPDSVACSNISILLSMCGHTPPLASGGWDLSYRVHPNRHHTPPRSSYDGFVQLPLEIRRAIEERAEELGFAALKRAAAAMSDAYRDGRRVQLDDRERVAAYLVTRMPATYAATYTVLRELAALPIDTILDVGSGTGAASLAARQFWPAARITMVERD